MVDFPADCYGYGGFTLSVDYYGYGGVIWLPSLWIATVTEVSHGYLVCVIQLEVRGVIRVTLRQKVT